MDAAIENARRFVAAQHVPSSARTGYSAILKRS
jgi:hypothetical protein